MKFVITKDFAGAPERYLSMARRSDLFIGERFGKEELVLVTAQRFHDLEMAELLLSLQDEADKHRAARNDSPEA